MTGQSKTPRENGREPTGKGKHSGMAGQPTTREEMLRDPAALDADLADPNIRGTRGGGHAAQSVGARHQEEEASGPGRGRYHKSDEKPWEDQTPPRRGRAPRAGNERA